MVPSIEVRNQDGGRYRYFWLKYVRAVDLSEHCAKSLIGEWHRRLDKDAATFVVTLDEKSPATVYYLCGVAAPYRWSNNTHLMTVPAPGERHEWTSAGMSYQLANLRPVEITREHIDPKHPKAHDRAYFTCRNWQGAWWMHKVLGLENRSSRGARGELGL
jgi:hypothetical protein